MHLFAQILGLSSLILPALAAPPLPLSSDSRWIVNANGDRVKFRCANWSGHLETNIPEGLNAQSIETIAEWLESNNFNCVRLTYSIDMALDQDVGVQESMKQGADAAAVSEDDMMDLYNAAVEKNPFLSSATRIQVFEHIVSALWDRGIMTILDNHVSKASWCCNLTDGNGWPADAPGYTKANSQYYDYQNWLDGLTAMAKWSVGKDGIVGMSVRNELRAAALQFLDAPSYWREKIVPPAGNAIHSSNPDLLIIIGGINGGTDLTPVRYNTIDMGDWKGKHVWEAHDYSFTVTTPDINDCDAQIVDYGALWGFVLEQDHPSVGPLWLSEFGVGMTGGPNDGLSDDDNSYLTCLTKYMAGNDADWAVWALMGSFYVRDNTIDMDHNFGILNHDWSAWRNADFPAMLGDMWNMTQGPGV